MILKYLMIYVILIFFLAGCAGGPEILPQEKIVYDVTVEALEKADAEIKLAEEEGADESMPKEYNKARGLFATAEAKLNEKKFSDAKELAEKARNEAKLARELPSEARSSINNAASIISSTGNSELAKIFPDLIRGAQKDLSEATKCLGKKDFVMAKVYARKVINELGLKKEKFELASNAVKEAENNINAAKLAEADKFLSDEFRNAEDYLKKAKAGLESKDFDSAKNNAESASKISKNALTKVPDTIRNLETTVRNNISDAKNTLEKAKQAGAEQHALELLKIAENSILNAESLLSQNKLSDAKESSEKAKSDAESVINKINEESERVKAEEEARLKAEEEVKLKVAEEARIKAEEEKKNAAGKAKKKSKKKK